MRAALTVGPDGERASLSGQVVEARRAINHLGYEYIGQIGA
jgi:hypothetical protein